MAILVTGGMGYIGSHSVVELILSGEEPIIFDNLSNSKKCVLDKIERITGKRPLFYQCDMLCKESIEKVFHENKIDTVIHFAGLKAVGESVKIPLNYYYNNLTGTLNLCMAMQKFGVYNLVFSSSATVYGSPKTVPITEDFPLSATNPYGETKLMIERILNDLAVADNRFSISILRYFNPIGAHESGLLGEDPQGTPNNLLPYIMQVAAGKLKELKVFGNDYPTTDGTGVRDYIHVVDLALAHIAALKRVRKHNGTETFNIGTGRGYSVLEVIKEYERASGKKIKYSFAPRRGGDIAQCYANPSKAEKILSWKAERNLQKMCEDSAYFQAKNPNGYND